MTPETELLIYDSMIFIGGSIIGMIAGAALQFHANRRGLRSTTERHYLTGHSDGWDAGFLFAVCTASHQLNRQAILDSCQPSGISGQRGPTIIGRPKRQRFRNLIRRLTGRVA